jgi:hypothetical protein
MPNNVNDLISYQRERHFCDPNLLRYKLKGVGNKCIIVDIEREPCIEVLLCNILVGALILSCTYIKYAYLPPNTAANFCLEERQVEI